jgi:uncharacterized damage-inducible protein DinB
MRNNEFFASCLENEIPTFGKVLRALPEDQLEYCPHERSKKAGDLAFQLADEMTALIGLFDNGEINMGPRTRPPALEDVALEFETSARKVVERARTVDEGVWKGPGKFLWDGNVAWEAPAAQIAWGFFFDLIHHRGQLSTYIRPMGGKVPAIYGPSGDAQA